MLRILARACRPCRAPMAGLLWPSPRRARFWLLMPSVLRSYIASRVSSCGRSAYNFFTTLLPLPLDSIENLRAAVFSEDSTRLFVAGEDSRILVYDLYGHSGRPRHAYPCHLESPCPCTPAFMAFLRVSFPWPLHLPSPLSLFWPSAWPINE